MSAKLNALEAKLSGVQKTLDDMVSKRDLEKREFTPEEVTEFNRLYDEATALKPEIDTERKAESVRMSRAMDKANAKTPEEKAKAKFSWARAINQANGVKDGIEGEMHKEAERELQMSGVSGGLQGQGIPSFLLDIKGKNIMGEKRDLTVGGSGTGAEYVYTSELFHQFGLEVAPTAFGLGTRVLTGLTGNVSVTQTAQASAVWETEVASNDETTPATSRPITLSPKRLGAFSDISKTLLLQTSGAGEMWVKTQLQKAVNRKLDETIYQGTGVSPIPYGIINTTGVNTATSSGAPGHELFQEMWAAIAADNADLDTLNIVTTPAIAAYLKTTKIDAGSGRFLWENDMVVGYNAIHSNNMPASSIIMGVFNQFVVGQWGGIDLVVNPYTRAKENILEIVINSFWDMGALYPEAFCICEDATL